MPTRPAALLHTLALVAVAAALAACATAPGAGASAEATTPLRPQRLMGTWYVISHVPWFAERGRVASRIDYAPAGEDRVAVHRTWREGFAEPGRSDDAIARHEPGSGHRLWRMRLFGVLPSRLRILEVADDDSWMLVDAPGRDNAWILAREAVVDDADYRELEKRIARHGVNTDKLRRVPQVPEQVDRLGFEPPAKP